MKLPQIVAATKKLSDACGDVRKLGMLLDGVESDAICQLAAAVSQFAADIGDIEWEPTAPADAGTEGK